MEAQHAIDALAEVDRLGALLRSLPPGATECEALDRITAFEELKAALTGAQAREAVAFDQLRRTRDRSNDVPAAQQGRRAGDEIGLARRTSPGTGRKFLTTARVLTAELPATFAALSSGVISEAKAQIIVDETADLTAEQRRRVDRRMRTTLPEVGLTTLRNEARALAAEIAADAAGEQAARAAGQRRVTMSPTRHGLGRVSATLPLLQAVAVYEGLRTAADTAVAAGAAEGRTHSQVMADLLVERATGQADAAAVPVEVNVVIDVDSLIDSGPVPAWLPGFGPVPSRTAREMIAANEARVFLRRLFTSPTENQLVGMESKRREFSGQLRRMVVFRDDVCRTPWCDARIKHADHAVPVAQGGSTTWDNASGLCASCNYAKEHPGWSHRSAEGGLEVSTPAGRSYRVGPRPFVTRMRVPRRSLNTPAGARDWRQTLGGFLEPERPPRALAPPPAALPSRPPPAPAPRPERPPPAPPQRLGRPSPSQSLMEADPDPVPSQVELQLLSHLLIAAT
ncbi:HNH endonuclease [Brevibacterium sanguinis]|uniref:HNH endonuclease n=2 Tax=Brevibacterium TaxID=1696 RepID=A0A366IL09_9MICO|nr:MULTISPECIES: DUF222 domain-containing protein [Brevibacterium]RBP66472.1 HNH endonuclease [Brevibacterium sanguinis]RBP73124.1 HNH endonuclease [Brevibacterium celere]